MTPSYDFTDFLLVFVRLGILDGSSLHSDLPECRHPASEVPFHRFFCDLQNVHAAFLRFLRKNVNPCFLAQFDGHAVVGHAFDVVHAGIESESIIVPRLFHQPIVESDRLVGP